MGPLNDENKLTKRTKTEKLKNHLKKLMYNIKNSETILSKTGCFR